MEDWKRQVLESQGKSQPRPEPQQQKNSHISIAKHYTYEWIAIFFLVVGLFYLAGQWLKGRSERHSYKVQILVGVIVAVLAAIVLQLLGIDHGVKLVSITVFGLVVITFALFTAAS